MRKKKIKQEPLQEQKPFYIGYYVTAIYQYRCKAAIINEDTRVFFKSRKMAQAYFDKVWHFYQKALEEGRLVSFERCSMEPVRFGT